MSYNDTIAIRASADLSTLQYMAIEIDGSGVAGSSVAAAGILANKPASGEDATLIYQGRSKFKAGGTVAVGNLLNVNSTGFFVAATSGDPTVGRCEVAASSGSMAHGIFNFAGVGYVA
jgi:hypothetical protein